MILDDYDSIALLVTALAAFGAVNWGATEALSTDILVDVLGLSGDLLTYTLLAIGVAGAIVLVDAADELTGGS